MMATNEEKKLRDRDKRLQSTYGITLEQYNKILEVQGGCCAACGRPSTDFTVSLNVDHEHFRVKVYRRDAGSLFEPDCKWQAHTRVQTKFIIRIARSKEQAIAECKKSAMPYSVRGLLCPGRHGPAGTCCNRNIGRIDNPDWLRKVIVYLEDPPARKVLTF